MRLLIQRVSSASVFVADLNRMVGSIERGVLVFVGLTAGDGETEIRWANEVIMNLKLWPNDEGKPWKSSVKSLGFDVLIVSQFTLYGKVYRKSRIDFHKAMCTNDAQTTYDQFVRFVRDQNPTTRIEEGIFGAMMDVSIRNDGPVTISVDSNETGASETALTSESDGNDAKEA